MVSNSIDPAEDYDMILVESEEDEDNIEDELDRELVDCVCDCDELDHDSEGCTNCDECTGHWE